MKEEKINISIDKELYEEANDLYSALGLDMESAIRVFLLASLRENGLPFMLKFDDCYCDDCHFGSCHYSDCDCDDCYCDDCDCGSCHCSDCDCDDCDCDDCDCEEHDCHCQKKISN